MFIKLTAEDKLDQFYAEAGALLCNLVAERSPSAPVELIDQAVRLNSNLVKQPDERGDRSVELDYDLWAFYQNKLVGEPASLDKKRVGYRIDRSTERWADFGAWCREVVWYGNKKGAYLYGSRTVHSEIAGHH